MKKVLFFFILGTFITYSGIFCLILSLIAHYLKDSKGRLLQIIGEKIYNPLFDFGVVAALTGLGLVILSFLLMIVVVLINNQ